MNADSSQGVGGRFRDDLALALRVWLSHPLLPLADLIVFAGPIALPSLAAKWLTVPLAILSAGFVGAERIWFLRGFRGESVRAGEVFSWIGGLLGRYLVLGLIVFAPATAIFIVTFFVARQAVWEPILVFYLVFVAIDVMLTFVTPALAFTTRSVSEALSIGFRMIKEGWPASAPYVLVPPLAVLVASRLLRGLGKSEGVALAGAAVGSLLNLLFKGATSAFYVRRKPTRTDGAVRIERHVPQYDHPGLGGSECSGPGSDRW